MDDEVEILRDRLDVLEDRFRVLEQRMFALKSGFVKSVEQRSLDRFK